MDAKAKVGMAVICLISELRLPHFASAEIQLYDGYEPKSGDALIPLTDHDAALADKEQERAEQWRLRREAEGSLFAAQAACASLRHERQQLLTGLEALAGEWERVVKQMGGHDTPHTNAAVLTCVRELRTLTNSANGGA